MDSSWADRQGVLHLDWVVPRVSERMLGFRLCTRYKFGAQRVFGPVLTLILRHFEIVRVRVVFSVLFAFLWARMARRLPLGAVRA